MSLMQRTLRASPSVVCATLEDGLVLLNVQSGVYFGVDRIGARIWELVTEDADEPTIQARLLEEYDVDPVALAVDIGEFITQLQEQGLVEVQE